MAAVVAATAAMWAGVAVEALTRGAGVAAAPGKHLAAGEARDEVGEADTTTELTRIEEGLKTYLACK